MGISLVSMSPWVQDPGPIHIPVKYTSSTKFPGHGLAACLAQELGPAQGRGPWAQPLRQARAARPWPGNFEEEVYMELYYTIQSNTIQSHPILSHAIKYYPLQYYSRKRSAVSVVLHPAIADTK